MDLKNSNSCCSFTKPGELFTYPFLGGMNVKLCAKELSLCDFISHTSNEEHTTLQLDNPVGRSLMITYIRVNQDSLNQLTLSMTILLIFGNCGLQEMNYLGQGMIRHLHLIYTHSCLKMIWILFLKWVTEIPVMML